MSTVLSRAALNLPAAYAPPPARGIERAIAQAFESCLRIDQVGVDDCFFDLGGDSVVAAGLVTLLERELRVPVRISLLASASTPRQLAAALGGTVPRAASAPVFAVHGLQGFVLPGKEFTDALGTGHPLHMFELPGLRDKRERLRSVESIAAAYCRELAQSQPEGRVHLAAFCIGGMVAVEMAAQLMRAGRSVASLVLIDPNVPSTTMQLYLKGLYDDRAAIARLQSEEQRLELEGRLRHSLHELQAKNRDHLQRRHPGQDFSVDARAKLMAAFMTFYPPLLPVRAHIIAAADRVGQLCLAAGRPSIWDRFLPDRVLHVGAETHDQIMGSKRVQTAELVRRIVEGGEVPRLALTGAKEEPAGRAGWAVG